MTPDAGRKVYAVMEPMLSRGEMVDIDFAGVTGVPSFFLNVTVGQSMQDFGAEFTRTHLRFHHITSACAAHFRDYFNKYSTLL